MTGFRSFRLRRAAALQVQDKIKVLVGVRLLSPAWAVNSAQG